MLSWGWGDIVMGVNGWDNVVMVVGCVSKSNGCFSMGAGTASGV